MDSARIIEGGQPTALAGLQKSLEAARVKGEAPYAYDVSQLLYDTIKARLPIAAKSLTYRFVTVTLHVDPKLQGGEFRACTCTSRFTEAVSESS